MTHPASFVLQPTLLFRRSLFVEVGGVNEALHYTMDYELWIRMFAAARATRYVPEVIACARYHDGAKSVAAMGKQIRELYRVKRTQRASSSSAHSTARGCTPASRRWVRTGWRPGSASSESHDAAEIRALLNAIEAELPVGDWQLDGVPVWPVFRIWFVFAHDPFAAAHQARQSKLAAVARIGRNVARYADAAWRDRTHRDRGGTCRRRVLHPHHLSRLRS